MQPNFATAMRRATLSLRAHDLDGAMDTIQAALSAAGRLHNGGPTDPKPGPAEAPRLRLLKQGFDPAEPSEEASQPADPPRFQRPRPDQLREAGRARRPLGEVLAALKQGRMRTGLGSLPGMDLSGLTLNGLNRANPPPVPEGAQYLARSFASAAGRRQYKLYIPACAPVQPNGLVVMLHGCKQNPDDFACGTRMNAVAEAHGLLVAYPAQPQSANASACWNWFNPGEQRRDGGEPASIAGITRALMGEFNLQRDEVFVAGLSAGGAMAAIMGEAYPDLFAAVGVHSGLACGSASDVVSAFATMRGDTNPHPDGRARRGNGGPTVRTIVFHGSADAVVHPSNADRIIAATQPPRAGNVQRHERIATGPCRPATRTVIADTAGKATVEYWLVEGAGHAWSGGDPSGSYTDSRGPDASAEMVRFFLANERAED